MLFMSPRPESDGAVQTEMDDVDTSPVFALRQILVVDDTPANLVAAEAALSPLNRTIVTATSGQDALARLLEQDFALVLLDVQMPVMDGMEFREHQRRDRALLSIPTVVLTGAAVEPLLDLAVDAALRKPVRGADLLAIVEGMPVRSTSSGSVRSTT